MSKRKVNDFSDFYKRNEVDYPRALAEIKAGAKQSHWIWYIFPQLQILGYSSIAKYFGLKSIVEATAYLRDPILGARLVEISQVALSQLTTGKKNINLLMGSSTDALKLRSSATLFSYVSLSTTSTTESTGNKNLFCELREVCETLLKGRDEQTIEACESELAELAADTVDSWTASAIPDSNVDSIQEAGLDFKHPVVSSMLTLQAVEQVHEGISTPDHVIKTESKS